jgi:hypothetical protein
MTKKTIPATTAPARPSRRTPGIVVRSGLRGGDTEKTESSSTKTSTTGTASNPAMPTLIVIK